MSRTKIESFLKLQQIIWFWIDKWMIWFQLYERVNDNFSDVNSDFQKNYNNLIIQKFLYLIIQFCTMLFQNSVILKKKFSEHFFWSDLIFIQQNYFEFAEQIQIFFLNVEKLEKIQIQKIISAIAQCLNIVQQNLIQIVNE